MAFDVGGSKKKKGVSSPEMNVTPLVDVVLVLLIIFMVIMPMMNAQFSLHVPRQEENEEPQEPDPDRPPIVVSVDRAGRIHINRDTYTEEEFPDHLRRMLVARGERKVYFDADDRAPFARAVRAMDLAREAGAAHIAVVGTRLQ